MTRYIAAYDADTPDSLAAARKIVAVHERFEMPATFFIVAELLDKQGDEYRALLGGHPLFEIASHTYTHALLRDHRICGKAAPKHVHEREIVGSARRLGDHFGRAITGFRPAVCWHNGLCGAPDLLALCAKAGYTYTSSLAWGPQDSLPALVRESFPYAEDGFPGLWEIPPCGWHENLLKGTNRRFPGDWEHLPLLLFPPMMPGVNRDDYVHTPEEEFEVHRLFLDEAVRPRAGHVSLIWHPWSLADFDPKMTMLDLTFAYVRERGLVPATFAQHAADLARRDPR